ncbi:MAG: UvrD-helicase domain-containing protein [Planctomycetes bacterium]|nr:UvrD-helicase domain-containing protein [Planctomycetota bacterium]
MSVRANDQARIEAADTGSGMSRMVRIVANAGSGKTYELSTRYIEIIAALLQREAQGGEKFNAASVLATTFTRAAAGEIRNRILKRLADAVLGATPKATAAQKKERASLEGDILKRNPELRTAFDPAQILNRLTQEFDRLEIRTIDSVFTRMAQSFGREAGLPLPLQFLSEAETIAASRRALQRVMDASVNVEADAQRLQSVRSGVAASSVERVLLDKVDNGLTAYRDSIAPGTDPESIPPAWSPPSEKTSGKLLDASQLAKAVDDLRRAVDAMSKPRSGYGKMLEDLNPLPRTMNEWREWKKGGPQASVCEDPHAPLYYRTPIPSDCVAAIRMLLGHIAAIEDRAIGGAARGWAEFLQRIDQEWRRMMAEEEKVTFESVTRSLSIAMRDIDKSDIAFRLDARIDHLLLDEFQDTSVGQWLALRLLAQEIASTNDDERFRSLMVVGDPKQSIYGWRAGEPRLLRNFESMIHEGHAEGRIVKRDLFTSWRSAPVILGFVDHLFNRLRTGDANVFADPEEPSTQNFQVACRNWTEGYCNHEAAPKHKDLAGCVQVRALNFIQGNRGQMLIEASAAIAIEQFRRAGGKIRVAIIARRNKDVARLVERIRAISPETPCVARAGGDLQTSPAVVAFLDVLRFSSHPGDTISLFGAATTPLGRALGLDPQWACQDAPPEIRKQRDIARGQAAAAIRRTLAQQGIAGTFSQWLRRLNHIDQQEKAGESIFDSSDRLRLARLIQEATQLEQDSSRTIDDLVESLAALRVQDPPSHEIEVINIHQAKGLEWDAVIYHAGIDAKESSRPTFAVDREQVLEPPKCVVPWITAHPVPERYQSTMEHAEDFRLQEQLSQLYVALTRARQGLWITAAKKKDSFGPTPAGMVCEAILTMTDATTEIKNGFEITTLGNEQWTRPVGDTKEGAQDGAKEIRVAVSAPAAHGAKVRALRSPSFEAASAPAVAPASGSWTARAAQPTRTPGKLLATERGTIAHLVAESVRWSGEWKPDAAPLVAKARALFPQRSPTNITEVVKRTIEQLQCGDIKSMLAKPEGDAALFNERKFVRLFQSGGVQEGIIDRVELIGKPGQWTGARIIDFKTDAFDRDTQDQQAWKQERAAHHAPQLTAYAQVIAEEHGLSMTNISMHLVLLEAQTTSSVSQVALGEE